MDFYIIDMDDEFASNPTHLLLGRPFMKTTRIKINVHKGTLSFEFDGEIITFNIFYVIIVQDDYEHNFLKDQLNFILQHNKTGRDARLEKNEDKKESIMSLHSLLKILNRLVKYHLQLSNCYERFYLLLNRPRSWN